MELQNVKRRCELKYSINNLQFWELKKRLSFLLKTDSNATEDGSYFIKTLYLDDYNNKSFNQIINGISKREKYRIRYYNNNTDYICLEKKAKENGITNKTSCVVTKKQVEDLLSR